MWMRGQVPEGGVTCLGRKGRNCSRDHRVRVDRPRADTRHPQGRRLLRAAISAVQRLGNFPYYLPFAAIRSEVEDADGADMRQCPVTSHARVLPEREADCIK